MKSFCIKLLFIVACITLASCNISEGQIETGELNVIVEQSRTIEPLILMEVDSYEIIGIGPDEANFHKTNVITEAYTVTNLLEGYWTVTVNALNTDGVTIATGDKVTYVAPNSSNICAVNVIPVVGSGTLYLTLDWTEMGLSSPQIVAIVSNIDGSAELPFIIVGNTASVTQPITNGYYNLNIQLKDSGIKVWGITEAIRIITDQTTTYDFVCE